MQNALSSRRATLGCILNAWPRTEGLDRIGFVSGLYAPKWRRQTSDQIRSDQKQILAEQFTLMLQRVSNIPTGNNGDITRK